MSVKWATCNVGAERPEDYGDYFAWGEVKPKELYDWSTYKYCKGTDRSMMKYCNSSNYGSYDCNAVLDLEDDAAHINWGSVWRMPTNAEQTELREKCRWEWTMKNGVNGYKIIGKNGNSIFLPAAGYMYGGSLYFLTSNGYYLSSSLYTNGPNSSYVLFFNSCNVTRYDYYRFYGHSIRPVCP